MGIGFFRPNSFCVTDVSTEKLPSNLAVVFNDHRLSRPYSSRGQSTSGFLPTGQALLGPGEGGIGGNARRRDATHRIEACLLSCY